MARIYVDIPVLEHSSGDVKGMGDSVESAGKSAKSAQGMAGDWEMDGAASYRAWIRGICSKAFSQARNIDNKLEDLGGIIGKKARDFLLADTASVAGLEATNSLLMKWIESSGILSKIASFVGQHLYQFESFLKLTGLLGGGYLMNITTLYFAQRGMAFWKGRTYHGIQLPWKSDFVIGEKDSVSHESQEGTENVFGPLIQDSKSIEKEKTASPIPFNPLVSNDNYSGNDNCVDYAKARRDPAFYLGPTGGAGGAADYITTHQENVIRLDSKENNLLKVLAPGYAVVWTRTHPYSSPEYGHVAIIEKVEKDKIWVSQRGVPESERYRSFSREELYSLQFLGEI